MTKSLTIEDLNYLNPFWIFLIMSIVMSFVLEWWQTIILINFWLSLIYWYNKKYNPHPFILFESSQCDKIRRND